MGGEKLQKNAFNTGASMRPVEKLGSSPLVRSVRSNGEFSVALPFWRDVELLKSIAV